MHMYCMRRVCIFLHVTHLKIIHSSFVPPSNFFKFWHDERNFSAESLGDPDLASRAACPGACEQACY